MADHTVLKKYNIFKVRGVNTAGCKAALSSSTNTLYKPCIQMYQKIEKLSNMVEVLDEVKQFIMQSKVRGWLMQQLGCGSVSGHTNKVNTLYAEEQAICQPGRAGNAAGGTAQWFVACSATEHICTVCRRRRRSRRRSSRRTRTSLSLTRYSMGAADILQQPGHPAAAIHSSQHVCRRKRRMMTPRRRGGCCTTRQLGSPKSCSPHQRPSPTRCVFVCI